MSKIFQLEGGQYEHPNEYKLVGTVRGTTILQPEFGTVIIEGDVIEASTHNTIQKNGVLASKVNVTMESTDTVLVPTDMTIESDLFNELKIILLFETGTTLPSNSFIKLKETNVPIANVNDYVVNANTPLLFLYFDSKFYAYKADSGTSTGASKLDDLSDVVVTSPTNGQALVYNGTNFVNHTVEEPAETYKGLQLGLVHSVIPVKSVANSIDYYTCDVEGIEDFGMHNELKLQMKVTSTNEYGQPKIKMNGNDYQIMRFDGVQLTQVLTGQLKMDNIYNLSFNGTLFILSSGIIAEKEVKALLNTTDFQATEATNGTSKVATQPEVDTGVEDTKIVTSKKLKARLDSMLASITTNFVKLTQLATETVAGIVKIATTSEVAAGVEDTKVVTSKKLKGLFADTNVNFGVNGYQKLPSGIILQWGWTAIPPIQNGVGSYVQQSVFFPIVFPNECRVVVLTGTADSGDDGVEAMWSVIGREKNGTTFRGYRVAGSYNGANGSTGWLAIGY